MRRGGGIHEESGGVEGCMKSGGVEGCMRRSGEYMRRSGEYMRRGESEGV